MTAIKVNPSQFGMCFIGQPNLPIFVSAAKHAGGSWNNVVGGSRPANAADPNDPAYNWASLDSFIPYAKAHGYAIEYILGYAPTWSNGGLGTQYPPTSLADYVNWCTAYLKRYSGLIAAVEPWNEVSDPTSATGYAGTLPFLVQMEQALRTVIDTCSPTTLLLTPSTYYINGLTYHAKYFAAGGGAVCDGLSWHAYPLNVALKNNYEQFDNTKRFYLALLAQYGKSGCPIWVTEGGYANSDGDPLAMGSLYALFMSCFATVSLPYAWNRPVGGNTSLDYWLSSAYPQDANPRGVSYRTMQNWLAGATVTQEPTRVALTNLVRNPDGSGSVAGVIGSGGAMPTNWNVTAPDSANGVTVQVLGTTTLNGETGVAVRISGTPTAGASGSTSFGFESGANQVAAVLGQQFSVGAKVAILAGSLDNIGVQLAFNEYSSGGSYLASTMGSANAPVVPLATAVYWEWAAKIASASCAYIVPKVGVSYTVGNAFDVTLFIKSGRADAGVVWTAALSRDNGWTGIVAWTADGSNPSYAVSGTYPWQRDATNALGPVQGGVSTLGRAPRLFESIPWGGYIRPDAPQYPHLLDTYSYKPSWQVAGVNYYVGVPSTKTLASPLSLVGNPHFTVSAGNTMLYIDDDNQVVDGLDLTGWSVFIRAANATIRNCKITAVPGKSDTPIFAYTNSSGAITIQNCTIDGGGQDINALILIASDVSSNPNGLNVTIQNCYLHNAGNDCIQFHPTGAGSITILNNLIENAGMVSGSHGDFLEFIGTNIGATIRYNTTLQAAGYSSQGFMLEPDIGASHNVILGSEIGYNVMIGANNAFTGVTVADVTVSAVTIHDNYFDPTLSGSGLAFGGSRGGPGDGNALTVYTHNVNMLTGALTQD